MLKTIHKPINNIYREINTCTVYTVLQSRGKDKVLLLGFPGLHKIDRVELICTFFRDNLAKLEWIRQWWCIIHDLEFLSTLYRSFSKFLVDGLSLLYSVSWKERQTLNVLGSLSIHGCTLLRGTCWGEHFPRYVYIILNYPPES